MELPESLKGTELAEYYSRNINEWLNNNKKDARVLNSDGDLILNADISSDRSCSASYGSLEVMRLRRWAVALVKNMGCNDLRMTTTEQREVIKEQISCYGASWLSSHIQKDVGCASFFIPP